MQSLRHFFSLRGKSLTEKVFIIIFGITLSGLALAWWQWEVPILAPIDSESRFSFLTGFTSQSKTDKVVYGFLPYWNLNDVVLQPELSHLAYFSLAIGADGSVLIRDRDGNLLPGYNRLGSEPMLDLFNQTPAQKELVFTQFNPDDIVSFLNSDSAQETFLKSLDAALLAYPFTGVNIDIEYSTKVDDRLRANYVDFIAKVREHLDNRYQHITLSIDTYAGAASRRMIWDIPALAPHVDYVIVMAYDFHRSSSTVAGPVAPLFGGKELWDSDISVNLRAFLESMPSEKVLLGVPFYGYEWQTITRDPQSHTFPDTGSAASYKRVQTLLERAEELEVKEHWNESALSPYISYLEDGEVFVIYYENSRSISYKLDFVNQLDLGGIAIWALGYEGESRELWEVIDRKLKTQEEK